MDIPHEWTQEVAARLDAALRARLECSHGAARKAIRSGKVRVDDRVLTDIGHPLQAGARLEFVPNAPRRSAAPPPLRVLHHDPHLIVIDKPSGLLSSPIVDGPPDLTVRVGRQLKIRRPKVVHRLDRDTSGLVVMARTVEAARRLRVALDEHDVRRLYRCVVRGGPPLPEATIFSQLLRDAGHGRRGSAAGSLRTLPFDAPDPTPAEEAYGQHAITRYRVVARDEIASALEVHLATGRTHQIRIHLSELRCPILGERVYAPRGEGPRRHALHAASLGFQHPFTGEELSFNSPWPEDLAEVTPRPPGW